MTYRTSHGGVGRASARGEFQVGLDYCELLLNVARLSLEVGNKKACRLRAMNGVDELRFPVYRQMVRTEFCEMLWNVDTLLSAFNSFDDADDERHRKTDGTLYKSIGTADMQSLSWASHLVP